jgi:hypothetical protein
MSLPNPPVSQSDWQLILEIYGANQSRWPEAASERFAALTGDDARQAQAALRDAAALDQVLARAPTISTPRQAALADRIMARMQAESVEQTRARPITTDQHVGAVPPSDMVLGNVVQLPVRTAIRTTLVPPATQRPKVLRPDERASWRVAVGLAAALVLGIGVGMSGLGNLSIIAAADTVGLHLDRTTLAFNDDPGGTMAALDDEDVL